MIVDFHVSRGAYISQGRDWTYEDLAEWADRAGIDVMVVESAEARLHSVLEHEHERLLAECRRSAGRFLPAASLNLASDVHSVELARGARGRGFACIVMHGELFEEGRVVHAVLDAVAQAPLPVYRKVGYGEMDRLYRVIGRHPGVPFVLEVGGFSAYELNHRLIELPNVYLSLARSLYCIGQIETAARHVGAERILFASDMPDQHPGRPLGVVADCELTEHDKRMVLGGSAVKLLRAHGVEIAFRSRGTPLPRPPCPIIDTHGHIGSDPRRPDFDCSAEGMLRYLRRAGGECIYVSDLDAIFGDFHPGNRRTVEYMRRYPDEIRGYLVINPKPGEACLAEVRGCRELGFVGLKPYPYTFGHALADPIMDPVYDLAETMGLCVLAHSDHNDLRAVLGKHPNLRMLAAHMSGQHAEKAELAREFRHCVLEISGAGTGLEDVRNAVRIAGERKIVFGSDLNAHPVSWTAYPLMMSGLPDQTVRAILRGNAQRYFA